MIYEESGSVDYGELQTGETVLGFAAHSLGEMNLPGKYREVSAEREPFGMELAW